MNIRQVRRKLALGLVVSLLSAGLAACASANGASTTADGKTVIRYQTYTGMINLPELADELGYLKDFQLKPEGVVQGGPENLRALVSGQVDYAGAFNGAIAQLASTGAPITSVISYYGSSGDVTASLLVLKSGGINSARDLIGKKVAVNTLGANAEAVLDTYLQKGGLSQAEIAKVTLVPLPGINEEAALREHKVDAAYLSGAGKESALSRGGLKSIVTDTDLVGPYNGGSLVLRNDFIAKNPTASKNFVAALAKALHYTQTHPVDQTRKLMQEWLVAHKRQADADALNLYKGTGVATPDGVIRDQDFDIWISWLKSRDDVKADSIKASDLYTNKFNPYAKAS
ncbi:MAG: transporter substrate-binding protein [Marmoricola sp.]|nr:transporter substrate-binding protein [Marmoricola sp.]